VCVRKAKTAGWNKLLLSREKVLCQNAWWQIHHSVFLMLCCSYLTSQINIKILICTGSILLYCKLVKSQEAFRGITLSKIYSAFKCWESTSLFSLTHNHHAGPTVASRGSTSITRFSTLIHTLSTTFLN